MVSSDGSFTPPEISAPALVLRASYGAEHAVRAGWEWAYRVGSDVAARTPLGVDGGGPGFRDLDAERAILADTVLAGTGLERFGLLDDAGRPADAAGRRSTGIDTHAPDDGVLPRWRERPGVPSRSTASRRDYRDVGDSLTIGVVRPPRSPGSATGSTSA